MKHSFLMIGLLLLGTSAMASEKCDLSGRFNEAMQSAGILKLNHEEKTLVLAEVVTNAAEECLSQGKTFDLETKTLVFAYSATRAGMTINRWVSTDEYRAAAKKSKSDELRVNLNPEQKEVYESMVKKHESLILRMDQAVEKK